jgi:tmRNA-binding protein
MDKIKTVGDYKCNRQAWESYRILTEYDAGLWSGFGWLRISLRGGFVNAKVEFCVTYKHEISWPSKYLSRTFLNKLYVAGKTNSLLKVLIC